MIKKEILHPKNNPQDDIYPKTSIDQVEELSGELLGISENLSSINDSLENIIEVLPSKANKTDIYTKTQVDSALLLKADKTDTYTKTQVDSALLLKADKTDTYTKTQVDNALLLKADKTDTYTKTQVDNALALKETKTDLDSDVGSLGYSKVMANPSDAGATNLTKLKIGNTIYNIPSGGGGGSSIYKHVINITYGDPMSTKVCKIILYDNNSTAYTQTSLRTTYNLNEGQPPLPPITAYMTFSLRDYAVITISVDTIYYMDLTNGMIGTQSYTDSALFNDIVTPL